MMQNRHLAILLNGPGAVTEQVGARLAVPLREIPIAVTGTWVKGDHKFSITQQDLADMVANFEKRKNDQVVIDFEHASEQPEIARGGPIPAAGWIHKLSFVPGPWSLAKDRGQVGAGLAPPRPDNGYQTLIALIEWTPQAEQMIKSGQYRFFSPAIDWGFPDKETGKPQGATLTSGALTNHPFLEELPPIMLTDFDGAHTSQINVCATQGDLVGPGLALAWAGQAPPLRGADTSTGYLDQPLTGGKKMKVKKMKDVKGKRKVYDDGDVELGELNLDDLDLDDEELDELLARRGKKLDDEDLRADGATGGSGKGKKMDDEEMSELLRESGVQIPESGTVRDELLKRLKFAASEASAKSAAEARALLLTEAVKDGALDDDKAVTLADQGKITFADYIRAQQAEKKLDEAVRAGKILPRDRKFFFRDALERPKEFSEYVEKAMPVINLSSVGLGSSENIPVDQEVDLGVKKLMSEAKDLSYGKALKQLFKGNPQLENRYRAAHSARVSSDSPVPSAGTSSGITQ